MLDFEDKMAHYNLMKKYIDGVKAHTDQNEDFAKELRNAAHALMEQLKADGRQMTDAEANAVFTLMRAEAYVGISQTLMKTDHAYRETMNELSKPVRPGRQRRTEEL